MRSPLLTLALLSIAISAPLSPGLVSDTLLSSRLHAIGIVDGDTRYLISCFVPVTEVIADPRMKELSRRICQLMIRR